MRVIPWDRIDEEKLPRKMKLQLIGRRMSRKRLRTLLSSFVVLTKAHGMYGTEIQPFPFCPHCGCQSVRWVSHHVEYPGRWEEGFCRRCGKKVWLSDNSPFVHVLEQWPECQEAEI